LRLVYNDIIFVMIETRVSSCVSCTSTTLCGLSRHRHRRHSLPGHPPAVPPPLGRGYRFPVRICNEWWDPGGAKIVWKTFHYFTFFPEKLFPMYFAIFANPPSYTISLVEFLSR